MSIMDSRGSQIIIGGWNLYRILCIGSKPAQSQRAKDSAKQWNPVQLYLSAFHLYQRTTNNSNSLMIYIKKPFNIETLYDTCSSLLELLVKDRKYAQKPMP